MVRLVNNTKTWPPWSLINEIWIAFQYFKGIEYTVIWMEHGTDQTKPSRRERKLEIQTLTKSGEQKTNVVTSILQSVNKLCAVSLTGARSGCAVVVQFPCLRGTYILYMSDTAHAHCAHVSYLCPCWKRWICQWICRHRWVYSEHSQNPLQFHKVRCLSMQFFTPTV